MEEVVMVEVVEEVEEVVVVVGLLCSAAAETRRQAAAGDESRSIMVTEQHAVQQYHKAHDRQREGQCMPFVPGCMLGHSIFLLHAKQLSARPA
jgi:hypothetical protein